MKLLDVLRVVRMAFAVSTAPWAELAKVKPSTMPKKPERAG
jgi:hypothetical protein